MTNHSFPGLVVLDDPRSLAAEAYRVLRIHYATAGAKPRSVLITSADVGAGKSTVTANLGILLAQIDRSVLLVDADLRRPVLHTLLGVPSPLGLSSYLSRRATLEAAVTRTSVPNLSLLPSGPIPPNPSDLLSSQRMRDLLRTLSEQYDVVLVDSPPVLVASDAATLASVVDGVLLVVGSKVPGMLLRRAQEQIEAGHGRILGAVINQVQVRRAGYRVLEGLSQAPQAAAARLGEAGRAAAALGAGVAGASVRPMRRTGYRVLEGLSQAPQAAAARLGEAGRAAAALGAGVAGASVRPMRRTGYRVLEGLSQAPQAAAARLGEAGRAAAALGAGVAAASVRPMRRTGYRVLEGLSQAPQAAAARLGEAGRAAAALGAGVAAASVRPMRRTGYRVLEGLSQAPQAAAARLGEAGRVAAALGAGVAAASVRPMRRTGYRVLEGLSQAPQAAAAWLGGAGRAAAALGAGVAGTSLRPVRRAGRRALEGLSQAPQAAAAWLGGAGRAAAALGAGVAGTSLRPVRRAGRRALEGLSQAPQAAARLGEAGGAAAALGAGVVAASLQWVRQTGYRVLNGLSGISQAAVRVGGVSRATAARSAAVGETSLRRLRHTGLRVLDGLAGASRAWAVRLGGMGRAVAAQGIALAETSQRQLGRARDQVLGTRMTTVLSGFATGLALVFIASGFLGRPAAPPDRTLPIAGKVSAGQRPRIAPSAQAASTHRGPAPGPVAEVRRPAIGPPASSLEVVAIRYGVVDRRQPDWTWSWRVTVHKPNDAARVNARIEYIEFLGSARRLVGYEELCGLRLASGPLESIEGTRTISAADSRRISAMTATVSPAEGSEQTACRPSSAGGRTPPTRGSQLRA